MERSMIAFRVKPLCALSRCATGCVFGGMGRADLHVGAASWALLCALLLVAAGPAAQQTDLPIRLIPLPWE